MAKKGKATKAEKKAKEKGKKYEIQAIIFEDLERYAADSQFLLFVLDDQGNVIDRRAPFQATAQ